MREKEFLPLVREKLGIEKLNPMQLKMMQAHSESRDIILLSPTGSGKTLAFILPMLKMLRPSTGRVQAVVVAPSRELVIQIAGIVGKIAAGLKTTPLYGGHKVEDEVNSLAAGTDIIVATPGRLLDHINRRNIDVLPTRMLVLDEFDKSLELGFETEMRKIVARLKNVSRVILTSATRADILPDFLKLDNPLTLDFLEDNEKLRNRIRVHRVDSDANDKLDSLLTLLQNLSAEGHPDRSIIFVNHRESAERVANFLKRKGLPAVLYHGALDQREREQAVARFNNGSRPVLVATDLAARGLDIKNVRNTRPLGTITTSRSLPKPGHTVTAAPPALMPTATYSCLSDLTRILRTMLLLTIPDILIRRKSPGWPLSRKPSFSLPDDARNCQKEISSVSW